MIEIGSGAGYKTVRFASEFRVIGVDFKSNVVLGRKLHPAMEFIDSDLDVSAVLNTSLIFTFGATPSHL